MPKQCREVKASLGKLKIKLNPVVTLLSAVIIWSLAAWCIAEPAHALAELSKWTTWVTQKWTWLYIGTQDVWAVFIIVIYFSKYSKMKLGKDHEQPQYSDATYFTMLFAAGIGIGLFYYGVAEPIWHYEPGHYGNRYWGRYSDNQRAQDAINLTLFHWGIHGWIVYVIVGLLLGFIAFRNDVPMTMRSCLYPLVGNKIYGTLGDIIDTVSIVCTMFGVCTSLGLGVVQINAGIRRVNPNVEVSITNQIIIIWAITAIATVSVISGIKVGIRRLSEICFALGMFIMLFVFFYDDTWFLLNLYVQSIGYYFQWFVQLGFHTDAFAQLGNAPDRKQATNWMDEWTIFYWGWWIAWSPFVGMFIARISRGRTIKEFINYTMTLPVLYSFMWFCIFGGAGIKMERDAAIANITCSSPLGGGNSTASFNGLYRLSCRAKSDMWFDVIQQYGISAHVGSFMSVVSLVSLVLYFVTSSDSGSLIIDTLGSNGDPEPPVIQRIFWALTEGAAATALLSAGGVHALKALQAVSVSSGLMYTVILNFMCIALWRSLKIESGDLDPNGPKFSTDLLSIFYKPSCKKISKVLVATVAPWWSISIAGSKLYDCKRWPYMVAVSVPFYTCVICQILQVIEPGLAYIGWAISFGFFAYCTGIRANMRAKFGINGNMVEDFFAILLLYPLAAVQMADHMEIADLIEKDSDMEAGSASGSGESLGLKHLVEKKPNGDISCSEEDIVKV